MLLYVCAKERVGSAKPLETAPMMLVRQQAQALIDARSTIVQGAVSIVHGAITKLEAEDVTTHCTPRAFTREHCFKGASHHYSCLTACM